MDRSDPEASSRELDDKQQQQLHQDEVEFSSEQNSVEDKMSSTSSECVLSADTDDLSKSNAGIQSPRRTTKANIKSPTSTIAAADSDSGDNDDDDDDAEIENESKLFNDRNEQQRLVKENGGASIKSKKRLLSNDKSTDHINGSENEEEEDFAGFADTDINEDKGNTLLKFMMHMCVIELLYQFYEILNKYGTYNCTLFRCISEKIQIRARERRRFGTKVTVQKSAASRRCHHGPAKDGH